MKKITSIKISGISLPLYAFVMITLIIVTALGKLPTEYGWDYTVISCARSLIVFYR